MELKLPLTSQIPSFLHGNSSMSLLASIACFHFGILSVTPFEGGKKVL